MTIRRQDVLILGGIVAVVYGLRAVPWNRLTGPGLSSVDLPVVPPFRRLQSAGQTSTAPILLVGIDGPSPDAGARQARMESLRANPCRPMFGSKVPTGVVPIAHFSDFLCPFCRALERDPEALLADDPVAYRLVQHELPIFGPPSELATRASVAAARQGKQQERRRRFMRIPLVAEDSSVRRVAASLGMDVKQLSADMASAEVQARLDQTGALADLFGFVGTPGLVIGRTELNSAVPLSPLRQVGEEEKSRLVGVC